MSLNSHPSNSAMLLNHEMDGIPSLEHEPDNSRKRTERISRQGAWNETEDPIHLDGSPALPMPVQIAHPASLAPFFDHLRNNGTHKTIENIKVIAGTEDPYETEMIEFERGVLYSDGRVDLCKMVTGPPNIGTLMDSLRSNNFARHFLLGNNIIGPTGVKAIAAFIKDYPGRFETWYLAGNCIDAASFSLLVYAMVKSPVITNVWLKRNPLGPSAAKDVFRLITQSPALRTLDLDQTELGDAGVAELFSLLSQHPGPLPLRHIYLNATGISKSACSHISQFLASPYCKLESLYMSMNPIGKGISALKPTCPTLQRLNLQSCGLKDEGTLHVLQSLAGHPSLRALDIGQAYATEDLGMRYNWLTDNCTDALVEVITTNPKLEYLNISYTPIPQRSLVRLLEAILRSPSLLIYEAKPLVNGGHSYDEVKAGQAYVRLTKQVRSHLNNNLTQQYNGMSPEAFESGPKRFIKSPTDVRLIDSVYRNRDAGLARRGLKRLEKQWEEGDDTLQRVSEGFSTA